MRQQDNENECWGLGKGVRFNEQGGGVKVFFLRRKGKGEKMSIGFCGRGSCFLFFIEG